MLPWDYHPELTSERLVKIAQLLALGRGDAVDRFDPLIGDDNWTLGVHAYSCSCFQISRAAEASGFEWLKVVDPSKHFQFSVGGVPMRFWRGDPSSPSSKISLATPSEQLLLELEPNVPTAGVLFRLGVTTDVDGALLGASFVALRNDQPELIWPIPISEAEPLIVLIDDDRPEGVDLPAPAVGDQIDDENIREAGIDSDSDGI
ncbi:hypothetical protein [uncultured Agrobacterium sp.]|uniref:hypothetical protein n=1 Tax=uncultured Agrobacterium sp. TaxID=157277 RepID=UPI00259128C6|nr:hypothetical protein [uncultured Agrobacterium sp.]